MKQYFTSRKSIPLGIGIWGFLFGIMILTFHLDFSFQNLFYSPIRLVSWILIILFIGTVWLGTGYYINSPILIIKIEPITERKINIVDIKSIERSYDIIASPANSFKRIKIEYEGGQVLISPKKDKDFLNLLKSINPDIFIFNLQKNIKL